MDTLSFVSQFVESNENCIVATRQLLRSLKVPVTNTTLEEKLHEHPEYPSLLCISEVLKKWNVESIGIKANDDLLSSLPVPFIANVKEKGRSMFVTVYQITPTVVIHSGHSGNAQHTESMTAFLKRWTNIVLLVDNTESIGEENYRYKNRKEIFKRGFIYAALLLPVFATVLCIQKYIGFSAAAISGSALVLLSLIGTFVSALLLWQEIDQHNLIGQKMCGAGKKVNCNAVLQSKAANPGGFISWSDAGFTYFSGILIMLLLNGLSSPAINTVAWLSVAAAPYVFFSLYYQWRVVKQWCTLCLIVQAILVLGAFVSYAGGLLQAFSLPLYNMVQLMFSFLIPLLFCLYYKTAIIKAREGIQHKSSLQKLKYNTEIFQALLQKQKPVDSDPEELGIVIGNPSASNKIIKVCNPYCGPCASAHTDIEALLEKNPDVQVRIIFTAPDDEADLRSHPVKHLMALNEQKDKHLTKQALNDWYTASSKDYTTFAQKYPLNGELQLQGTKLTAMHKWCEKTGISFTPTFFINGYQLPDVYQITDVDYFLNSGPN